jgi:hypothetical protein
MATFDFTFHNQYLGIQVGKDESDPKNKLGLIVQALNPRPDGELSAAQKSGIISRGDRITGINGVSLCGLDFNEGRNMLESTKERPCTVSFVSHDSSPSRGKQSSFTKDKVRNRFRSSRKTSILREINSLTEILQSEKNTSFNVARGRLDELDAQIVALRKTIDVVEKEIADGDAELEELKESSNAAFQKISDQISTLQSQKKLLVKEIRAQRIELNERGRASNLYRHAIVGVEKDLEKIRMEKISASGRAEGKHRSIEKSVLHVAQRTEELRENSAKIEQMFENFDEALLCMDRLEHFFQMADEKGDSDTPRARDTQQSFSASMRWRSSVSDTSPSRLERLFSRVTKSMKGKEVVGSLQTITEADVEPQVKKLCALLQTCSTDLPLCIEFVEGIVNSAKLTIQPAKRAFNSGGDRDEEGPENYASALVLLEHAATILEENATLVLSYCSEAMRGQNVSGFLRVAANRLETIAGSRGLEMRHCESIRKVARSLTSTVPSFY